MIKTKSIIERRLGRNDGQALLIVILIATVLLTIGISMVSLSRDETNATKLGEESKRAFAAAEAGIDAAVKLTPGASVNINSLGLGSDIGGTATVDTAVSNIFNSPLLNKDSMYTFYLTGYNPATATVITGTFENNIRIDLSSPTLPYCGTTSEFSVELTFVSVTSDIVARRLIDECGLIDGSTSEEVSFGQTIATSGFANDPHLLFLRIMAPASTFPGARLVLTNLGGNWPLQGKTITSTAQTGAGVAKKVRLFQSYPQIPAEFFVTSF